ncbi:DUF3499 domain-containing protein [Propionibacteriaceae bacterium Y2011]
MRSRPCSKSGCSLSAVQTLTYVYTDSTAVLGPLATRPEPHTYDLCRRHATSLSAPRGWEVIRISSADADPEPSTDDLLALADAVREVGFSYEERTTNDAGPAAGAPEAERMVEVRRRGHLRMLADPASVRPGTTA